MINITLIKLHATKYTKPHGSENYFCCNIVDAEITLKKILTVSHCKSCKRKSKNWCKHTEDPVTIEPQINIKEIGDSKKGKTLSLES